MPLHITDYLTISDIPEEAIKDCTTPGQDASEACAYWREELGLSVDRENALHCLKGYGAWELEEMREWDNERLADTILWLACGSFREFMYACEEEGIDPRGSEFPDDFSPNCGSDIFTLT